MEKPWSCVFQFWLEPCRFKHIWQWALTPKVKALYGHFLWFSVIWKRKCVWPGITTITHRRPTHGILKKSHSTLKVIRHQENNKSNYLSLPHQDNCETRKHTMYCIAKQGSYTESSQAMGATLNNETTTQNCRLRTENSISHCNGSSIKQWNNNTELPP